MATPGPPNPQAVTAQVKKLINTQLKQVLRGSGLPISGAKAALQTRIIDRRFLLLRKYHHYDDSPIYNINALPFQDP